MKWRSALMAIGGCLAGAQLQAAAPIEKIIAVPGFADFLAVDGDTVWVTNKGRVERWSQDGRLMTVSMSHPCGTMAVSAGSLWVADCKDKTLNRIDLVTGRTTAVIATGIASPDGELNVVSGAGSIWVASHAKGKVARVDPTSNSVTASVAVAADSNFLAFGSGYLWAVSGTRHLVQKIDPRTNRVAKRTPLGRQPGFLAVGEGAVWVQEQADGTVARIDPSTATVTGRVKVGTSLKYGDIDTGGGSIWLRTTDDQTFVVIDSGTLAIRARVGTATGSGALRYTPSGIWTTAHDKQTLSWWREPAAIGH